MDISLGFLVYFIAQYSSDRVQVRIVVCRSAADVAPQREFIQKIRAYDG